MNELIQKLAEAAGLDARTMGFENNHTAQWNARVTKLTELIVQECCEVLREEVEVALTAVGDVAYPERLIKQHFGVEE